MRILVAGGTGFIGRRLCAVLADAGHEVTVLSRRDGPLDPRFKGVTWSGPWQEALGNSGAVVNLCGENVAEGRWTAARKTALSLSRVETTRRVVAALAASARKPGVLLNASAVGYYGDRRDELLDERSAPGSGFLAELCKNWEAAALQARKAGVRTVCLRLGVVLGRDGGALARMAPPFSFGLGGPLGPGTQYMPWIHIDDAVGLLRHAMDRREVEGPVNGVSPRTATNEEFSRELAAVLGRPCLLRAPAFALRLALGEMAEMLLASERVEPAIASQSGFNFRYPGLQAALRDCLTPGR